MSDSEGREIWLVKVSKADFVAAVVCSLIIRAGNSLFDVRYLSSLASNGGLHAAAHQVHKKDPT